MRKKKKMDKLLRKAEMLTNQHWHIETAQHNGEKFIEIDGHKYEVVKAEETTKAALYEVDLELERLGLL